MFINRCYEKDNSGTNMNNMINDVNTCPYCQQCCCQPIMECPQERVCHREMCYEVPHIIPINTRIVNHHIYKHTYQPMYTCTMEDEVCNVYDQCGGNF